MNFLLSFFMSSTVQKLLPGLFAAALAFAAGGWAAEQWEHSVPWGLGHQLTSLKASLPARDAQSRAGGIADQKAADEAVVAKWQAALAQCDGNASALSAQAAAALSAGSRFTSAQAAQAYALGRATCGVPNAPPAPSPAALSCLGSLPRSGTDLRSLFGQSAYAPAAQVPVPGHR